MKTRTTLGLGTALLIGFFSSAPMNSAFAGWQQPGAIDTKQLRSYIEEMGLRPTVVRSTPGDEMFEYVVTRGSVSVYVDAEVSSSKNYVWLSSVLGKCSNATLANSAKLQAFLRNNFKYQPCNLALSDRNQLEICVAIDNRSLSSTWFRNVANKLADAAFATRSDWAAIAN